jgi:hypothetical protein
VSAIIILAIFFKFNRFWSVRNFDLAGLLLLTPGLLFLAMQDNGSGYVWLFSVQILLLVRLLFDLTMVRRPLLEPNLSAEGLTFSCLFLFFFLIAAMIVNRGEKMDTVRTLRLEQIITARHIQAKAGMNPDSMVIPAAEWDHQPPGFRPFLALTERANLAFAPPIKLRNEITPPSPSAAPPNAAAPSVPAVPIADAEIPIIKNDPTPITIAPKQPAAALADPAAAESVSFHPEVKTWLLILSLIAAGHLVIVLAFAYIGYRHFGRLQTGIACAALYLLHPYSNQMLGRLDHVIPAALLLWSTALYRRPILAGLGIGAATALVWYPICLVPLWCSFYQQRGWIRFLCGVSAAIAGFVVSLSFSPPEWGTFGEQLLHLGGKSSIMLFSRPDGFWTPDDLFYRVPVLAGFFVFCFGALLFPAHKHLATLIGGSALLMLGVQFCQLYQGGLYMSWYLPLLILAVFRPNLEDRTARSSVA